MPKERCSLDNLGVKYATFLSFLFNYASELLSLSFCSGIIFWILDAFLKNSSSLMLKFYLDKCKG